MDVDSNKVDAYVVLRLGMEERRTRYKDDAGCTLVVFNEVQVLSFSKRLQDDLLGMQVLDKGTDMDHLMGERDQRAGTAGGLRGFRSCLLRGKEQGGQGWRGLS
jgi:hypothetical protein